MSENVGVLISEDDISENVGVGKSDISIITLC
jgi:hypothetical protein